jgi:hypothetical protein
LVGRREGLLSLQRGHGSLRHGGGPAQKHQPRPCASWIVCLHFCINLSLHRVLPPILNTQASLPSCQGLSMPTGTPRVDPASPPASGLAHDKERSGRRRLCGLTRNCTRCVGDRARELLARSPSPSSKQANPILIRLIRHRNLCHSSAAPQSGLDLLEERVVDVALSASSSLAPSFQKSEASVSVGFKRSREREEERARVEGGKGKTDRAS